jgi:hypothetical protein
MSPLLEIKKAALTYYASLNKGCKELRDLPILPKVLLSVSLILLIGLLLAFRSLTLDLQKLTGNLTLKDKEIQNLREELLAQKSKNIQLAGELESIERVAQKYYPNLKLEWAISQLLADYEHAKEVVLRYDYLPLSEEKKIALIKNLKKLKEDFGKSVMHIEITYESWVSSSIKKLIEEIVDILSSAELNVSGPELMAVYRVMPAYPVELEYNAQDEQFAQQLYSALQILINPDSRNIIRKNMPKGKMRIHFTGQAKFGPDGTVTIY